MNEAHQAIRVVAQRTGLSAHVIRMWEKRYGAVEPVRTGTNRRLYSQEQVERLSVLKRLTDNGHSIGNIAALPTEQLRSLAEDLREVPVEGMGRSGSVAASYVEDCVRAVRDFDSARLEDILNDAASQLGVHGVLQRVIAPFAQALGDLWRGGSLTAVHEHFASGILRVFLGQAARPYGGSESAPVLLVATPSGQIHELGALMAAAAASDVGWKVVYLGTCLPVVEIAGAVKQNGARALALSLVYPEDDQKLVAELEKLGEMLPSDVTLLVGGRAAPAYRETLAAIGAVETKDLSSLCSVLDGMRRRA